MHQNLSDSPTALANLTEDVVYTVQSQTAHVILMGVHPVGTPPVNGDDAFRVARRDSAFVEISSGEALWIWVQAAGDFGHVVYDEAV